MNESLEACELQTQARRLLRFRVPLLVAVLTNLVLLARLPHAQIMARARAPEPSVVTSTTLATAPTPTQPPAVATPLQELTTPVPPPDAPFFAASDGESALASARALTADGVPWRASAAQSDMTDELTLHNDLANGGPVSCLVDGQACTLLPGESRSFPTGAFGDVQFQQGDSFGVQRQQLSAGAYRFVVTRQGWNLEAVAP